MVIATVEGVLYNIFPKVNKTTGEVKKVLQVVQKNMQGKGEFVNITTDQGSNYDGDIGEEISVRCQIGAMKLDNGTVMQTVRSL